MTCWYGSRRLGRTHPIRLRCRSGERLDLFATGGVSRAAVTADRAYFIAYEDSTSTIRTVDRGNGEVVDAITIHGWVTGVPVNRDGEVLVTTWDYLILPSGAQLPMERGINSLAW